MTQNQIGDVNQGSNKFGLGFSIVTPAGAAAKQPGMSEGSVRVGRRVRHRRIGLTPKSIW
ncbi:MAG: hypothetical protein WKG07_09735 [Hymenobacter sp.]